MAEDALVGVVSLLAFAGGAALFFRLIRTGAGLMIRIAEVVTAAGLADMSARRGDLTEMMERRRVETEARRARRTSIVLAALWLGWLIVPVFAGWGREAYALAAVLWLLPNRPLLRAGSGRADPGPP